MGWMHDTLKYMALDPVHRSYHHHELTFRMIYAYHENFILPLSHDEVVYGKGSLLRQMSGDDWQKFANLRLLYAYMWAQPGKKLLFMGDEFAQWNEWYHEKSLDWHLTGFDRHAGMQKLVADLNQIYRKEPALHRLDTSPGGFEWIEADDALQSCYTFLRHAPAAPDVLIVLNFTPVPREDYRIGVLQGGRWDEILNSDAAIYSGTGNYLNSSVEADDIPWNGRQYSINLKLPPLGAVYLKKA
jgi:1,4-alpha-glucan branching enzyme